MRKIDDSLQYCLIRWGESRAKTVPGLSYPGITAEARLIHSPGRSQSTSPPVPVYTSDPVARRVEAAFSQLERQHQPVLVVRYELCLPETKARRELNLHSRDAYRWAVEKAVRAIGRIMGKPIR